MELQHDKSEGPDAFGTARCKFLNRPHFVQPTQAFGAARGATSFKFTFDPAGLESDGAIRFLLTSADYGRESFLYILD